MSSTEHIVWLNSKKFQNTQIYAFLAVEYSGESAQAFSVFKFFMHLFTCVAFYYSKVVGIIHSIVMIIWITHYIQSYNGTWLFSPFLEWLHLSVSLLSKEWPNWIRIIAQIYKCECIHFNILKHKNPISSNVLLYSIFYFYQ